MSLAGRTIVVTGGLGRVGRAVGETLAAEGARAILTTRDAEKAARFAAAGQLGLSARVLSFDSEAEVRAFADALAREGPVHGLVNNAYAATPEKPLETIVLDDWAEGARVNLGGALSLSRALVEGAGCRAIVNVGSIYGVMAPDLSIYAGRVPPMPTYGAFKAGLVQLTRHLAIHWAERGVRVNAVSLGGVSDGQDEAFLAAYAKMVPTRRMIDREEAAAVVAFLLSEAASGVTGTNLMVDAGRHAW